MSVGQYKNWIESPKWASVPLFIKNLAFDLDLELQIEVDKGFIRETTHFKVNGEDKKIDKKFYVFPPSYD